MTEDEHTLLTKLAEQQEEMSQKLDQVHKFLYDPPYEGARGADAEETMAQWLYTMRKRFTSADVFLKAVLYLAGLVSVIGGAWMFLRNGGGPPK